MDIARLKGPDVDVTSRRPTFRRLLALRSPNLQHSPAPDSTRSGATTSTRFRSTPGRVVVKGKRENLSAGIHGMPSTTGTGPCSRHGAVPTGSRCARRWPDGDQYPDPPPPSAFSSCAA